MYDTGQGCALDLSKMLLMAACSEPSMTSFRAWVGKSLSSSDTNERKADYHDDGLACHYCREHGHMHHNHDKTIVCCPVLKAQLLSQSQVDSTGKHT